MKSARFLVVALLPLLAACAAAVPTYVWKPFSNPPATVTEAEKNFRIAGYVLDAGSCRPVPAIVVRDKYSWHGTLTDANGHFVLHLPNNLYKKNKQVVVETVFYEGSAASPADTAKPITLLLKRNAYRFEPYGCQHLADTARIPPHITLPILGLPGSQYAFLIQDSTARQPSKLKTLTFRFGPNGFPREPFRIRIYRYNGPQQHPGEDLLTENVTVQDIQEGLFSFDISSYNIQPHAATNVFLPANGFFVSLEWMVTELRGITYPIETPVTTGPILRPPCARADIRTWEYVIGKGWQRATAVENCWPLYESALSVEVESVPTPPTRR